MRSFTQLTGSTTANAYPGSFCDLTQNNSAGNLLLAKRLVNDEHRYLIQKYFDNERTYTGLTVGAEDITLTGSLSVGALSGTLPSAWANPTCQQLVVFSSSEQRTVLFTQNSTTITWTTALTEAADADISTVGVQAYPIAANVSKIKNDTITIGQLVYTTAPVQSIQEWTLLNALPYTSDIPAYFYLYNNQVNFWPIPSSSGNIISFNYQTRVADMTYADYATGTVAAVVGDNRITGTSTDWIVTGLYPQSTDLSFANLMITMTPPKGDGIAYPIQQFTSGTALTLNLPVVNVPTASGISYIIGQYPLLHEDFQDLLIYGPLRIYYTSIVKDDAKFKMYDALYEQKKQLMEAYLSNKSTDVDLGSRPIQANPNLFLFAPPQ